MFPKKSQKKPVMGMMPGKGKADLSEPESFEPKPKAPPVEAEAPEVEAAEDYSGKLKAEIESAGEEHGLDAAQSKAVAASMFRAMAKCLAGEENPIAEHDAGGQSFEAEEE